jgi:hypothetical protein
VCFFQNAARLIQPLEQQGAPLPLARLRESLFARNGPRPLGEVIDAQQLAVQRPGVFVFCGMRFAENPRQEAWAWRGSVNACDQSPSRKLTG